MRKRVQWFRLLFAAGLLLVPQLKATIFGDKVKALIGWLWAPAKSYAAKLVNPGGVEVWKCHPSGNVADIDSPVDHFGVTPRQIIRSVAQAVDELKLPHPVHIHANNLGLPGNWATTLETMKVLEGHRGHMTHIQFHSYGGGIENEDSFSSKVAAWPNTSTTTRTSRSTWARWSLARPPA